MTIWADSLVFQSLLEAKIISFRVLQTSFVLLKTSITYQGFLTSPTSLQTQKRLGFFLETGRVCGGVVCSLTMPTLSFLAVLTQHLKLVFHYVNDFILEVADYLPYL